MITVALEKSEVFQAALLGCIRNIESWDIAQDKHGADTLKTGWQINIMATLSEIAWAKHANLYYNGAIGNYAAKDVGEKYQMRCSSIAYKHNARLRLHQADKDTDPYILALVGMTEVVFVGWLLGVEGKRTEYWGDAWKTNRPAFFVPQKDLHPIEELPV